MGKYSIEIGGFIMVPDVIVKELGFVTAGVYGKIWRYEHMEDGVCRARQGTIADDLGISRPTLRSHIKQLEDNGYIVDMTPDLRNVPHRYKTTGKLKFELSMAPKDTSDDKSHCKETLQHCKESFHESEDNDKGFVFSLYESTIGFIPANLVDDLKDTANEYPREWIERAFKIAAENNARNWRYVRRVLENIKAKGIDWTPSQKAAQETTPTEPPAPVKAVPPPAYLKEAWYKNHPQKASEL